MRPDARTIEKLIVEARARITWGDSPAQVRDWLLTEKINDFEADEILRDLLAARSASMRKRGIVNLVVGTGAIAVAAAIGILPGLLENLEIPIRVGRAYGLFMAGAGLIGIYGAKQWIDGIERLLRGAKAEGADTDMIDD
jgi:hypothetical protein